MVLMLAALAVLFVDRLPRLHRPRHVVDEARFLAAIATELRGGAALRTAIADAAGGGLEPKGDVRRLGVAGGAFRTVTTTLGELPINGRRAATAIRVADIAGGTSADVFLRLSDRAVEEADLQREKRALTTQGRLSALVVGGLPLLGLLVGGGNRIGDMIALGPGGAAVAAVGLGMQVFGLLLVWKMAAAT